MGEVLPLPVDTWSTGLSARDGRTATARLARARAGRGPLTEVARSEFLFQRHLGGIMKDSAMGFGEGEGGRWLRWWLMFFAGRTGMQSGSSGP